MILYSNYLLLLSVIVPWFCDSVTFDIECPGKSNSQPSYFTYTECINTGSCTYYSVSIGPNGNNNSFVDFYLETSAKGYAAVGFSKDRHMPSTDVLGCGRDSNGVPYVRDTWNPAYYNEDDPNQDGVCIYNMTYEDSILKCSFSRISVFEKDFDLNDTYYLMFAYSNTQEFKNGFPPHSYYILPRVSDNLINVYVNSSVNGIGSEEDWSERLVKAHGILMTVAWPLLAAIGIFFSAWTKPAFPKGQWFQFHRALMISSIVVSSIGLICVFVAQRNNTIPGIVEFDCGRTTAHFAIGISVTMFQFVNPLIALCRPKPDSKYRFIFNLVHGSGIGFLTEAFALVNVGLGIALFQTGCMKLSKDNHILWIYIVWIAFVVILQGSLFCFSLISSLKNRGSNLAPTLVKPLLKRHLNDGEMSSSVAYDAADESSSLQEPKDENEKDEKPKSKDSGVRSVALGVFCVVTFIFTIILVVLLAID